MSSNVSDSCLKHRFRYVISLDVFGVHGVGGFIGTLLTGVFATAAIGGTAALIEGNPKQVLLQLYGGCGDAVVVGRRHLPLLKAVAFMVPLRLSVQQELEGIG